MKSASCESAIVTWNRRCYSNIQRIILLRKNGVKFLHAFFLACSEINLNCDPPSLLFTGNLMDRRSHDPPSCAILLVTVVCDGFTLFLIVFRCLVVRLQCDFVVIITARDKNQIAYSCPRVFAMQTPFACGRKREKA